MAAVQSQNCFTSLKGAVTETPPDETPISCSHVNSHSMSSSGKTTSDTLTRQQLIFFFCHSSVCLVKTQKATSEEPPVCKVPHCAQSISVLHHLNQCSNSRLCGLSACHGLRWARDHYSSCKNMSCLYCEPVRKNKAGELLHYCSYLMQHRLSWSNKISLASVFFN